MFFVLLAHFEVVPIVFLLFCPKRVSSNVIARYSGPSSPLKVYS